MSVVLFCFLFCFCLILQKTGNAIRALGRMATLSANSRRNSASAALCSPRLSISNATPIQINRLNDLKNFPNTKDESCKSDREQSKIKTKSNSCDERSDSGFSECSNCNSSSLCHCLNSEKCQAVSKENFDEIKLQKSSKFKSEEMTKNASISNLEPFKETGILKANGFCKHSDGQDFSLETIPEKETPNELQSNESNLDEKKTSTNQTSKTYDFDEISSSPLSSIPETMPLEELPIEQRSKSRSPISPDKESIRRSDFTNTVLMRKHSLELKTSREKVIPKIKPTLPPSTGGTVSRLKLRFSQENFEKLAPCPTTPSSPSTSKNTVSTKPSQLRMELRDVFERVSVSTPNTPTLPRSNHSSQFNFNRNSNSSVHSKGFTVESSDDSRSPVCLKGGRVKEATDRLTNPNDKTTNKPNNNFLFERRSGTLPRMKNNNFKLASDFWKN